MDGRTVGVEEHLSNAASYALFTGGGAFLTAWMTALTKIHYDNNDMSAEAYVYLIIGTVAFCGTVVAASMTAQSLCNAAGITLPKLNLPTLPSLSNLTSYFKRQIVSVSTPKEDVNLVIVTSPPPTKISEEKRYEDEKEDIRYTLFGMSQLSLRP